MQSSSRSSFRPVAIWMYTGVIMLLIQVVLGGITRLTGSGLSITEWKVITGALPPLNHTQWQEAFDGYRHTQQYQLLNSDFTLSDYQFIYFWEWFHRLWARMVGVVFLVGFGWLLWKQKLQGWMIRPLIILFLLGALQGAVGWIMVASGFVGDAIYVAPTKLALHFVFALVLVAYTFWFALELSVPYEARVARVFFGPAGTDQAGFRPPGGCLAQMDGYHPGAIALSVDLWRADGGSQGGYGGSYLAGHKRQLAAGRSLQVETAAARPGRQ